MENKGLINPQDIQIQGVIDRYLRSKVSSEISTSSADRHLDEDSLAAFTEGNISRREAQPIVSHLIDCSFCRHVTAELIKLDMAFADDEKKALYSLQEMFPNATYRQMVDLAQQNVLYIFTHDWTQLDKIKLHLKGTEFQLKVWETLLKIPMGQLTTYGSIAKKIQLPNAYRAVGSAIGDNPVAFLIPCHRIIQSTGMFGGYHWGSIRKTAIIGWEASRVDKER